MLGIWDFKDSVNGYVKRGACQQDIVLLKIDGLGGKK